MVNPDDKLKCNGWPVVGWVVNRVSPGAGALRKWLELFKPGKVPADHEVRPLTYADVLPEPVKAAPMPPPAPAERPPTAVQDPIFTPDPFAGVAQLRKDCLAIRAKGYPNVAISHVLKLIGEE